MAQRDAELTLILPLALAPWNAANRVSVFVEAWLAKSLFQRGLEAQDVSFAVNELMENAIKYASDGNVELSLGFGFEELRISIAHLITTERAAHYRVVARDLIKRDPAELFAEIIARNSESSLPIRNNVMPTGAGLGLVSLRMDYQANLGFAFNANEIDETLVTTQVCLPLPNFVHTTPIQIAITQSRQ